MEPCLIRKLPVLRQILVQNKLSNQFNSRVWWLISDFQIISVDIKIISTCQLYITSQDDIMEICENEIKVEINITTCQNTYVEIFTMISQHKFSYLFNFLFGYHNIFSSRHNRMSTEIMSISEISHNS